MEDQERPKLNLRANARRDLDEEVGSLLHRDMPAKRGSAGTVEQSNAQRVPAQSASQKPQAGTSLPAAGSILRERGKRSAQPELNELWDIQEDRKGESIFATQEVGEAVEKAGVAIGRLSQRFKSAYKDAKQSQGQRTEATPPRPKPRPQPVQDFSYRPPRKLPSAPRQQMKQPARPSVKATIQGILGRIWARLRQLNRRQMAIAAIVLLVLVVGRGLVFGGSDNGGAVSGASTLKRDSGTATSQQGVTAAEDSIAVVGRDTVFPLVFPTTLAPDETGIAVVSPPDTDPVYAFNDEVDGAVLSISQQEVPDQFKPDVQRSLEELAASFAATDSFQATDGSVVYHGYSDKNGGVQSLLTVKDNLLILISSSERLSDSAWADYIGALN